MLFWSFLANLCLKFIDFYSNMGVGLKWKKSSGWMQPLDFRIVGILGLEPRMTGPESVVLPLHHIPRCFAQEIRISRLRCKGTANFENGKVSRLLFCKQTAFFLLWQADMSALTSQQACFDGPICLFWRAKMPALTSWYACFDEPTSLLWRANKPALTSRYACFDGLSVGLKQESRRSNDPRLRFEI